MVVTGNSINTMDGCGAHSDSQAKARGFVVVRGKKMKEPWGQLSTRRYLILGVIFAHD